MSDTFWIQMFGTVTVLIGAVAAVLSAKANKTAKETHVAVNSRMDEQLEATKEMSENIGWLKGKIAGAQEEKDKGNG